MPDHQPPPPPPPPPPPLPKFPSPPLKALGIPKKPFDIGTHEANTGFLYNQRSMLRRNM
ncbi:hypothetical protein TWF594_001383 [Orbilia oligospora]|nr:hypothetical protein TWF594_001383 [Orbilia oligospora]